MPLIFHFKIYKYQGSQDLHIFQLAETKESAIEAVKENKGIWLNEDDYVGEGDCFGLFIPWE